MGKRRSVVGVFVDSSVLFTAVNSVSGGSAKLFTIRKFKLVTSRVVLAEVERNVRKKLASYHLARFFMLADKLEVTVQLLDERLIRKAKQVIVEKDAVILAEARQAKADYLVTLDRKDFFSEKVKRFLKPQKAVTPKMLFEAEG